MRQEKKEREKKERKTRREGFKGRRGEQTTKNKNQWRNQQQRKLSEEIKN